MNLKDFPFDIKHINNQLWYPSEEDEKIMGHKNYNDEIDRFKEGEKLVMFKNLIVEYDSCDCPPEAMCGHSPYPFMIRVYNNKKVDISFEDEGIYFEGPKGFVRYNKISDINMNDFVVGCSIAGIELIFSEFGEKLAINQIG